MPYPREFKQSTTVSVNDARGHTQAGLACQIFKPLLAVSINGPQALIVGHSLPNSAAVILRALVLVPASSLLDIRPGPAFWPVNHVPSMVLSEDPNSEVWWWTDAVPWNLASGKLWSVFATKEPPASPPPPPPPPPATPIILGGSAPTAALITLGTTYSAIVPPFTTQYAYAPLVTGAGDTLTVAAGAPASLGSTLLGGNHMLLPTLEGGPISGPGTITVPPASHTGPDMVYAAANAGPTPDYVVFTVTSP